MEHIDFSDLNRVSSLSCTHYGSEYFGLVTSYRYLKTLRVGKVERTLGFFYRNSHFQESYFRVCDYIKIGLSRRLS